MGNYSECNLFLSVFGGVRLVERNYLVSFNKWSQPCTLKHRALRDYISLEFRTEDINRRATINWQQFCKVQLVTKSSLALN